MFTFLDAVYIDFELFIVANRYCLAELFMRLELQKPVFLAKFSQFFLF